MARREVTEVVCGRCDRVETQSSEELPKNEGNEFQMRFQGKKVVYDDLCRRCRRTLTNYFEKITMPPKEEKDKEVKNPAGAG